MEVSSFWLTGALHPTAIGDGFVIPLFATEGEAADRVFVQECSGDSIVGFKEAEVDSDEIVIATERPREVTIGDRPLVGFRSRSAGLVVGNRFYICSFLSKIRDEYESGSSILREIDNFLETVAASSETSVRQADPTDHSSDQLGTIATVRARRTKMTNRKSVFVAEHLERGYGLTIGNALRRVLLSVIPGAAITKFRIRGVRSEFERAHGVREDVTDIALNLKQVALKIHDEGPHRLTISAVGPRKVTAGDIVVPDEVEIADRNQEICTLEGATRIDMLMIAEKGFGYAPASTFRAADDGIGTIPLDAFFSPVRQVSYKTENARSGSKLDYDKLSLTVETDGTIAPRDALTWATRHLQATLEPFALGEPPKTVLSPRTSRDLSELLRVRLDDLDLSVRTAHCLRKAYIFHIGDLVQLSETEFLKIPNLGRKSLNEVTGLLQGMGLRLGMDGLQRWSSRIEELDTQSKG